MTQVTMRAMLEAGVHFGHQKGRWNPKMRPYIWGAKNGIHIIDLQKTARLYRDAVHFASRMAQKGEALLFVGTKRQAQDVISEEAARCKQPYVNHRWLGGMLTNFRTIRQSIERLDEIDKKLDVSHVQALTKKEVIRLERERNKLLRNLGGIREMGKAPGAIFIVDTHKEHLALREARRLKIPVIALVDTNSDPDPVDYPIPSNDDAIRAIRLFTRALADAYVAGAQLHKESFVREHGGSKAKAPMDVVVRGGAEAAPAPAAEAAPAPAAEAAPAPEAPAAAPAPTPAAEAPADAPKEA